MAKLEEVESTSPPHPTDIGTLDTADSGGLQQKAQEEKAKLEAEKKAKMPSKTTILVG